MNNLFERLRDRVVLVTGAGSGIGRAVSLALVQVSARVVAADLRLDAARETAALARELAARAGEAEILALRADVRSEEETAAMVERALERFGRLDALVASAGILRPPGTRPKTIVDTTPFEWAEVLETNLTGTFLSDRAALPPMIRQRSGQVVNISSTSGLRGRALDGAYCASKFGIVGLTESLAEEVRPHGIRVQVLLPDAVATPLWEQNGPFGPPADALDPERIAEIVLLLMALPGETTLHPGVVAPFHRRKRRAPSRPRPVATSTHGAP